MSQVFESPSLPSTPQPGYPNCEQCPLKALKPKFPTLKPDAALYLLHEYPYTPTTKAGELLKTLLARIGVTKSDTVNHSSALLCKPPKPLPPKLATQALKCCAPRVEKELEAHPGDKIIGFGPLTLELLTDHGHISEWTGAFLPITRWVGTKRKPGNAVVSKKQALITINPGIALADPPQKVTILHHLAKGWQTINGLLPPWTWPRIVTGFDGWDAVRAALDELESRDTHLGVDTETAGLAVTDELKDVALADEYLAICAQWPKAPEDIIQRFITLLQGPRLKVLQNGMFDYFVFRERKILLNNFAHDTTAAAAVLIPRLPRDLGFLSALFTNADRYKSDFRALSANAWRSEEKAKERAIYCARDAFMCRYLLDNEFLPRLQTEIHKGVEQYEALMAEIHIAIRMRSWGVWVDQAALTKHHKHLSRGIAGAARQLKKLGASYGIDDFNPAAPAHIKRLFTALKATSPALTASGLPSYTADILLGFTESPVPAIRYAARLVLIWRRLTKLDSTYIIDLPELIHADNRIRPNWKPFGAATRRWSCSNPNLQQIAKRRNE